MKRNHQNLMADRLLEVFRLCFMLGAGLLMLGCGEAQPAKPALPSSVSPGWQLKSLVQAAPPRDLAASAPACWQAEYEGQGTAEVWVCGYSAEAGAFDAVQMARAEAQTVKFQEGKNLILVHWNGVPKASLEALVRAIQKTLK